MSKFENMTNNEILMDIQRMQIDFEAIKQQMLKDNDKLELIEENFVAANAELVKRLKGEGE